MEKFTLSFPLDVCGHISPPLGRRGPRARNSRTVRNVQSRNQQWLLRPVVGVAGGRRMEEWVELGAKGTQGQEILGEEQEEAYKGEGWERNSREERRKKSLSLNPQGHCSCLRKLSVPCLYFFYCLQNFACLLPFLLLTLGLPPWRWDQPRKFSWLSCS